MTATKDATNFLCKISFKLQMWQSSDLCLICSWAAYVVGCIIVLMHEEQAVFKEGLSLLINSEVPDGKGVSSSAALEVASMSAIASAYGIKLQPSHLASLCQKVVHPSTHSLPLSIDPNQEICTKTRARGCLVTDTFHLVQGDRVQFQTYRFLCGLFFPCI